MFAANLFSRVMQLMMLTISKWPKDDIMQIFSTCFVSGDSMTLVIVADQQQLAID